MNIYKEAITHVAPHLGLIYSMPLEGGPTQITQVEDLCWDEAARRFGTEVADTLAETYPRIPRDLAWTQRAAQYRAWAGR